MVFLAIFLLTVIMELKGKYDFRMAAIGCALAKIALDFLRDTHVEHLITRNQVMCTGIIIAFLVGYAFLGRKRKSEGMESNV